jgi:hypothetical protein
VGKTTRLRPGSPGPCSAWPPGEPAVGVVHLVRPSAPRERLRRDWRRPRRAFRKRLDRLRAVTPPASPCSSKVSMATTEGRDAFHGGV